jgi:putative FmdB family regulatory protein|uniref:Zinc ribbon domain-containing protein n=1 Tax=Desulfobacca acetoxidans TaxID=60893 RepID=A0A7C5EKU4_9BACT
MPIFEYLCPTCGREFEKLVLKKEESVACPDCGRTDLQPQLSVSAFKTDYHGFMSTPSSGYKKRGVVYPPFQLPGGEKDKPQE